MTKKLTVGISSFKELITGNFLYVDKTRSIYDLFKDGGRFFFLARPRRFGKTLLISTLKELFEGNRELFKGLWIDSSDYAWEKHTVLTFNFSARESSSSAKFTESLEYIINETGEKFGINLSKAPSYKDKLETLVTRLADKEKVVILVDEYDFPVISNIHNSVVMQENLKILKGFFTAVKAVDHSLRAIFITGVSQIPKASIFTGLSDLNNISLDPLGATLLGYTKEEVESYFSNSIMTLAGQQKISYNAMLNKIQLWYNGYRFSKKDVTVYNPFSLHCLFTKQEFDNYWFQSATPSFLFELLKKNDYIVKDVEESKLSSGSLTSISLENPRLSSLLFQTGYLTISSYDEETRLYTVKSPNLEVGQSYGVSLLSAITQQTSEDLQTSGYSMRAALKRCDLEEVCSLLQVVFASIPYYIDNKQQEAHYHALVSVFMMSAGLKPECEVATNRGRADLVLCTQEYVYIFEIKVKASAESALQQIEEMKYYERFKEDKNKRTIVLVGLAFNKRKGESSLSCASRVL